MEKSVRFSATTLHCYETDPPDTQLTQDFLNDVHTSVKRRLLERTLLKNPRTQLTKVTSLVASFRNYDVSIVFGNLGRQPHLLNYYLDLCFSHEDDIILFCDWDLPSNYKTKRIRNADFLIHVEPYFGYTVQKYSGVKHVVILTSHLYLELPDVENVQFCELHLSNETVYNLPNPNLENCKVFKPSIFHLDHSHFFESQAIVLDVTDAKSAHEAYLRLLTGREIICRKPFKIIMNPRDVDYMKKCLPILEQNIKRHWNEEWMANFYWKGYA